MNDEQFRAKQIESLTLLHSENKQIKEKVKDMDDYFRDGDFKKDINETIGSELKSINKEMSDIQSYTKKLVLLLYLSMGIIGSLAGVLLKLVM